MTSRLALGLVSLVIGSVAGCGTSAGPDPVVQPSLSEHRRIDLARDSGLLVMPMERYFLSESEQVEILDARSLALSACANQQGLDVPHRPIIPEVGGSRLYGVWVEEYVAEFGYALPTTPEKEAALVGNSDESTALTPDELAVLSACAESDEDVISLDFESVAIPGPVMEALSGLGNEALASDEASQVLAEWQVCLERDGLRRDIASGPFDILGATGEITEQNIQIALKDVACKTEVDLVARLAQIQADVTAPVLDQYATELADMRREFDGVLDRARSYTAAHG